MYKERTQTIRTKRMQSKLREDDLQSNRHGKARAARIMRERQMILCAALTALILAMICGMVLSTRMTSAMSAKIPTSEGTLCYKSILIESGDTVWSIADREMGPEWKSKDAFVREVAEINHVNPSSIHSGNYLTIPYYSAA